MDPGRGQFSASMEYSVKFYFVPTKAWPTCMMVIKGQLSRKWEHTKLMCVPRNPLGRCSSDGLKN
jgi:hypothetical protein